MLNKGEGQKNAAQKNEKEHQRAQRQLRQNIRCKRRALSSYEQKAASLAVALNIEAFSKFKRWKNIAIYLAQDGELDLSFWRKNFGHKKNFYLPIVDSFTQGKLKFGKFDAKTRLKTNLFGIPQPSLASGLKFNWLKLDVIFLPLVAFDKNCNRLGMGGGFYDKSLARLKSPHFHRPQLIGIAHSLQEVPQLNPQQWDIQMDTIITDKKILRAGSLCEQGLDVRD